MARRENEAKSGQKTLRITATTQFAVEVGAQLEKINETELNAIAIEKYVTRLFRAKVKIPFDDINHANIGVRWCRIYGLKNFPLDDKHKERQAFVLEHRAFFFRRSERGIAEVHVPNVETICGDDGLRRIDKLIAASRKNYWAAGEQMADELRARGLSAPVWPPKKGGVA